MVVTNGSKARGKKRSSSFRSINKLKPSLNRWGIGGARGLMLTE